MPMGRELHLLAGFTLDPAGGDPAGVRMGSDLPEPAKMQRLAAEVGHSAPFAVVTAAAVGLIASSIRGSVRSPE